MSGDLHVRDIDDAADVAAAADLLARIWEGPEADVMPVNLLKALAHSGNYVAGAWSDGRLVGASAGWVWGPDRPAALHSHITGVDPAAQGRGVGIAIKRHQAEWARAHGITTVTWTFDPLIRRNGRFNLSGLGAVAVSYHPNFYGHMPDGINAGDETDRCFVEWDVTLDRPHPRGEEPAAVVLRVGGGDRPETAERPEEWDGPLLCQVPADAVALRRRDRALGREWRLAVRATMGTAMAAGYAATAVTPDGYYVLERKRD